jgi:hypothetical protein
VGFFLEKPLNLGVIYSGSTLYGDFGTIGLWKREGAVWTQLTTSNVETMVASGSMLYGDFGALGIWKWNGTVWSQLPKMAISN